MFTCQNPFWYIVDFFCVGIIMVLLSYIYTKVKNKNMQSNARSENLIMCYRKSSSVVINIYIVDTVYSYKEYLNNKDVGYTYHFFIMKDTIMTNAPSPEKVRKIEEAIVFGDFIGEEDIVLALFKKNNSL